MSGVRLSLWLLAVWFTSFGTSWAQAEVVSETVKTPEAETPAVSNTNDSDRPTEPESGVENETTNTDQTDNETVVTGPSSEEVVDRSSAVSPQPDETTIPASAPTARTSNAQPADVSEIAEPYDSATPRFGEQGRVSIDGSVGIDIRGSNYSNSDAAVLRLGIAPSFDYFVVEHFSIGGFITLNYDRGKYYPLFDYGDVDLVEIESSYIGVGPRVGYNFTFSAFFSWYVRLGFSFGILQRDMHDPASEMIGDSSEQIVALDAYAPLLAHVAKHFYIGFGPSLYTELSHSYGSNSNADTKETTIGARLIVGGWL